MASRNPNSVFTPRAAQVNDRMYVPRPELERRLRQAMASNKYVVIHGESGNGKTWLYKKVFQESGIHFDVINLGSVLTAGSLEAAFSQKLGEWGYSQTAAQETNSSAGFKPGGMGVDHSMKSTQSFHAKSPITSVLERVRFRANDDKPAALILDNFESIIGDKAAVRQIAGLIVSADDESVARHEVKIVIVGTPTDLRDSIVSISGAAPIANRLTEIPEVARMSPDEARSLMKRGFVDELGLGFGADVNEDELYDQIGWLTDRIAQHVHELCLAIANGAVDNADVITKSVVDDAIKSWSDDSLSTDAGVIERLMNSRDTKIGRKNQVLFALGQCEQEDFRTSDIETLVRDNFTVRDAMLNVSQILSGFASASNPVIRRTPAQEAWRFVSPKFRMALRSRLRMADDERVFFLKR